MTRTGSVPQGRLDKVILPIEGMHCASCVAKVEKALLGLRGVKAANVHLPSRTAAVEYDRAAVDEDAIRRAVESQGYHVPGTARSYEQAETLLLGDAHRESMDLAGRLLVGAGLWLVLMLEGVLRLSDYTSWLLALPVQLWCAAPFHRGFLMSVRRGRADMHTLVSLSTWSGFLFSTWAIFLPERAPVGAGSHMLESVAGLVVMILLGRWLEARMRGRANDAVRKLIRLSPKTVRVRRGGSEVMAPAAEVAVGERFVVRPGEQIGLDGVVEEGASTVDESLLTGESLPAEKGRGASVFGGTMNKTGALVVRVTRVGPDAALARIVEAVRAGGASKAPIQKAVDRAAAVFVPAVILLAVAAGVAWSWKGPEPKILYGLTALISVLAVACPCALGLATPMAVVLGTGRAAELGILLRNGEALEKAGRIDAVLFDKTGTLTEGRPSVVELAPARGTSAKELLRWAATAEQRSEHPFAAAVRDRAAVEGVAAGPIDSFESIPGQGIRVASGESRILAGSLAWLTAEGFEAEERILRKLRTADGSALGVVVDGRFRGAMVLADRLRPTAKATVARLKEMGFDLILVSGDRNRTAHQIAEEVGIGKVYAEVLPQEKSRIIRELQEGGRRVAMVGEGFNDAPALSQADIGIALAVGTDVAVEAADITLMNPDLRTLVAAIELSRRIRRVIRENLAWAFLYNALLLPVAAGALYPVFGVMLKPQFAGAAMGLSSLSVIANSMKLRRFKP